MPTTIPTPEELRSILITHLAGVTDTSIARWRDWIVEVIVDRSDTSSHCNWSIRMASGADATAIAAAIKVVSSEYPYVQHVD